METFYFSPKNACMGELCNSKGKCCVMGQFALQFGEDVKKKDFEEQKRIYQLLEEKFKSWLQFTAINDSPSLTWAQKCNRLRKLFKKYGYKMIVKKEDMV